jgi:glycerol-3-phosphate O-acyltransferase
MYATALRQAAHRGLVEPGDQTLTAARKQFLADVTEVIERLDRIAELEENLLEAVLDRWDTAKGAST